MIPKFNQIADNLWIGGVEDGEILPQGFQHIVSLCVWEQYKIVNKHKTRLEIVMYDNGNQSFALVEPIAKWVNECRKTGVVLVHCKEGLNRSALIVARVLMLDGLSANDAINLIRAKRSNRCLNNQVFVNYLRLQNGK
jgi:protein-tyrosine phosphatase